MWNVTNPNSGNSSLNHNRLRRSCSCTNGALFHLLINTYFYPVLMAEKASTVNEVTDLLLGCHTSLVCSFSSLVCSFSSLVCSFSFIPLCKILLFIITFWLQSTALVFFRIMKTSCHNLFHIQSTKNLSSCNIYLSQHLTWAGLGYLEIFENSIQISEYFPLYIRVEDSFRKQEGDKKIWNPNVDVMRRSQKKRIKKKRKENTNKITIYIFHEKFDLTVEKICLSVFNKILTGDYIKGGRFYLIMKLQIITTNIPGLLKYTASRVELRMIYSFHLLKKYYTKFAHPIFLEIIFEFQRNVKNSYENFVINAQGLIFCLEMIITHISYSHLYMTFIFFFYVIINCENNNPQDTTASMGSISPDNPDHGSFTKPTQLSQPLKNSWLLNNLLVQFMILLHLEGQPNIASQFSLFPPQKMSHSCFHSQA
ncbi:hypothetical protein VP01_2267g2 [Puccinia sorghi]|uniref:Uncharacterized protein n=1 Tax=Puccinia sorghi TaxID=27349 RepID=A0A0L6V8A8_9BASI|nr:hypothetical protein VP01_2267g2 [Puccinia sorghi]